MKESVSNDRTTLTAHHRQSRKLVD
jgi:hypothetical protein